MSKPRKGLGESNFVVGGEVDEMRAGLMSSRSPWWEVTSGVLVGLYPLEPSEISKDYNLVNQRSVDT